MGLTKVKYDAFGVVFRSARRAELEDFTVDTATLPLSEVLIKSDVSLVSPGTELAYFTGETASAPEIYSQVSPFVGEHGEGLLEYPARTGYANAGTVVWAGSDAPQALVGRRVLAMTRHASMSSCDPRFVFPIPESMPSRDAVFARIAGVGMTALRAAEVAAGDRVVVLGLGLVGNLTAQLLQLAGAEVVAFDPDPGRRRIATLCGVREVVDPGRGDPVQFVRAWAGGGSARGADTVVEATGIPAMALQAIEMTAMYGTVVLLGSPRRHEVTEVTSALARVHWLALRVLGGLEWRFPLAADSVRARFTIERNYQQVLQWIAEHRLITEPLITETVSPSAGQVVYDGLAARPSDFLGMLFDWQAFG